MGFFGRGKVLYSIKHGIGWYGTEIGAQALAWKKMAWEKSARDVMA
jgi:hypothetical protein